MREEVFKIKYERYDTVLYHTSTPLTYPHPSNNTNSEVSWLDDLPEEKPQRSSRKRKSPLVYIEKEQSTSEESYIENYGNPLASVSKTYGMVVVEKDEDKVSLKLFWGFRERKKGVSWFKNGRNVDYITVNVKTGDVYNGFLHNFQKKRKASKKVRRNSFIGEPINTMKHKIRNVIGSFTNNGFEITNEVFSKFMKQVDGQDDFETNNFEQRLFRFYLNKREIKYPNNFHLYSRELHGPKIRKFLKKNDNRLVDAFMKSLNLSGKNLKKALHNCARLNVELYLQARNLFGDDWINQEEGFILNVLNSEGYWSRTLPAEFLNVISKDELRRVFKIFKRVYFDGVLDSYTFYDHIRMYTELKLYGETDLRWMSDDNDKTFFRKEHLDWTDKIQFYKRGHYERFYPDYFYKKIETPIKDFYPVILNNSTNYNEESSVQSNCVKTYIGRPSSFIVSLRKGSRDSDERATIEYRLSHFHNVTKADRVQSLGRFNSKLDDEWLPYLLRLDEQVLSCMRDKRFKPVKLTKKCVNGTLLSSDSEWDEMGVLRWTYRAIENNGQNIFEWL